MEVVGRSWRMVGTVCFHSRQTPFRQLTEQWFERGRRLSLPQDGPGVREHRYSARSPDQIDGFLHRHHRHRRMSRAAWLLVSPQECEPGSQIALAVRVQARVAAFPVMVQQGVQERLQHVAPIRPQLKDVGVFHPEAKRPHATCPAGIDPHELLFTLRQAAPKDPIPPVDEVSKKMEFQLAIVGADLHPRYHGQAVLDPGSDRLLHPTQGVVVGDGYRPESSPDRHHHHLRGREVPVARRRVDVQVNRSRPRPFPFPQVLASPQLLPP